MRLPLCRWSSRSGLGVPCWLLAAAACLGGAPASAQHGATGGEWRTWAGDLGATRYAPLDQIDAGNFGDLEIVWRYKTGNLGPRPDYNLQSTPLVIDGVLYTTAGSRRSVVALDAATGEQLWMYRLDEGERAARSMRRLSGRGVGYWTDGAGDERIYFVTIGYQLVALDAGTGRPIPDFGVDGIVDLKQHNDQDLDPVTSELAWNGAPVVAGDIVIVGAASRPGGSHRPAAATPRVTCAASTPGPASAAGSSTPSRSRGSSGTKPGRTAPGSTPATPASGPRLPSTPSSASPICRSRSRPAITTAGTARATTSSPRASSRSTSRPASGSGTSSSSTIPIWDYDVPCAPILADITVDGRAIKAIAQPTKQGWVYVFDRVTGEPVWPIEERPVPAGDIPGETYSPTQPFPTKPPPFERQGLELDEVIDLTPEIEAEALRIVQQYRFGPIFTPPITRGDGDKFGTLFVPNGANWPGGSYDPETGILYVFSHTLSRVLAMRNDPARSDMAYINGPAGGPGMTVQGLPLMKPPWGRITAIDLNRGRDRLAGSPTARRRTG